MLVKISAGFENAQQLGLDFNILALHSIRAGGTDSEETCALQGS